MRLDSGIQDGDSVVHAQGNADQSTEALIAQIHQLQNAVAALTNQQQSVSPCPCKYAPSCQSTAKARRSEVLSGSPYMPRSKRSCTAFAHLQAQQRVCLLFEFLTLSVACLLVASELLKITCLVSPLTLPLNYSGGELKTTCFLAAGRVRGSDRLQS